VANDKNEKIVGSKAINAKTINSEKASTGLGSETVDTGALDAKVVYTQNATSKVDTKTNVAYSIGAFGHDAFYITLSAYFIMFVTDQLFKTHDQAFNNKMIGAMTAIIVVIRLIEITTDPILGGTIDNTNGKWGKFKPWIVGGGISSSFFLILLFTDLGGINTSHPTLYLIAFALIYFAMDVSYSAKDIAFWSMLPALSFSNRERERIGTSARIGSTLGQTVITLLVMPIVLFFTSVFGGNEKNGWFSFAVIIALLSVGFIVITALGAKENDSLLRKTKEKTRLKDVFNVLASNNQLLWLAFSYGLYTTAVTISNSFALYYFKYIFANESMFWLVGAINVVMGLAAVVSFPTLTKLLKRRNLFFLAVAMLLVGYALFFNAGQTLPVMIIAIAFVFAPQPLIFLVVLMTIADAVEYGQWKTGKRNESVTLSVRPLLDKLAGAISNGVVGITAVICGMTSGAIASSITTDSQLRFKLIMFGLPATLVIISAFIFFKRVKLDENMHIRIVKELEKRAGG
jgi:lactose/raffinose/galactose permease